MWFVSTKHGVLKRLVHSEYSNTSERCCYGGGLDSIEWTNTASGCDTQLLKNSDLELMRSMGVWWGQNCMI